MHELILVQLAGIITLGIAAQWIAWRMRLPAILLLLLFGFVAGPAMELMGYPKFIAPDLLLGDLLLPVVALSVAVILFDGGLTLNLSELALGGQVIRNLVTIGALTTWAISAVAAYWLLDLSWTLSILLGAILVVTGPTVIGPLLRHVRPLGHTGPILKWEGIIIDPVGAMLAVLVFEALPTGDFEDATSVLVFGALKTLVVGTIAGLLGAAVLAFGLKRYLIPGYLQNPLTLMLVVVTFTASDLIQHESGLFAVTAMGIALANQRRTPVTHIAEFKENLTVLLVSALFILLASRLTLEQLRASGLNAIAFTAVLILVARPAAVLLSTIRSGLNWPERVFLMSLAPRGIVAAAVASVFALRLQEAGYEKAEQLVPITFTVIVGTVLVYGLAASWLGRQLGISSPNSGFLIAGANPLARAIAQVLQQEGQTLLLVDSDPERVRIARLMELPVINSSVVSSFVQDRLELTGIGRLLALTPNEEANSLATLQYSRFFGREGVYQLAPDPGEAGPKEKVAPQLQGRVLFGAGLTYEAMEERLQRGKIKRTDLSDKFTYDDFLEMHAERALVLFTIREDRIVEPVAADTRLAPKPGQTLISLVLESDDQDQEQTEQRHHQA